MEVIYTLIPAMILLGIILVLILVWAVRKGQYDDLEGDGNRILLDDDDAVMRRSDAQSSDRRNWPDADHND